MSVICNKSMKESECEIQILKHAIEESDEFLGKELVNSQEIKKLIGIVEDFIKTKGLICYGGTAINNILPEEDQFYDKKKEVPDYDFFSPNALDDTKELADIYAKEGYQNVLGKAGIHYGTFKIYVHYIAIADVTHLDKSIYNTIKKDAIMRNGILYAPPNFLKMSMYLELSRPHGDVSRWEKVLHRLSLLNKHYPLKGIKCETINFSRGIKDVDVDNKNDVIYEVTKETFISQDVIFIGGYANSLYAAYMPPNIKSKVGKIADFDIVSDTPEAIAEALKKKLNERGINNVKIERKKAIGDVVGCHVRILVGESVIAYIYKPIACYSYNMIKINNNDIKIATIDTMLSFYLAFIYSGRDYYDTNRILCLAEFLFNVEYKHRIEQKGILKRFPVTCYGYQKQLREIKMDKDKVKSDLRDKKGTREYENWFLDYKPTAHTKYEYSIDRSYSRRSHSNSSRSGLPRSQSADSHMNKVNETLSNISHHVKRHLKSRRYKSYTPNKTYNTTTRSRHNTNIKKRTTRTRSTRRKRSFDLKKMFTI